MASMNDNDKQLFAAACRVDPEQDLPEQVERAYWEYKKGRDALNPPSELSAEEVATVVYLSGFYKGQNFREDPALPLHEQMIKFGEVMEDAPILISWRLGKPRKGKFKQYAPVRNKVIVLFDGEVEPREFDMNRVMGLPGMDSVSPPEEPEPVLEGEPEDMEVETV